jgi:hypothetical protein
MIAKDQKELELELRLSTLLLAEAFSRTTRDGQL